MLPNRIPAIFNIIPNICSIFSPLLLIAANESDLLDIYPANTMLWPYFRKNEVFIVGIAKGYEEAVELACHIVAEVYTDTGNFDVKGFILKRQQ